MVSIRCTEMTGRIFLIREKTFCAIWDYPGDPIAIIGEMYEELTNDSVIRLPIVTKFTGEPIVCPYCMCDHETPIHDGVFYPECNPKRKQSVLKDELNIEYNFKIDGYYIKHS